MSIVGSALIQASTPAVQGSGALAGTPRAAGNPVQVQTPDVATLQSQLADLRVQLSGLQAKWDGLYSQLDVMLRNNPARPAVQQQWADVGIEIARVKGEIAYREAQIARAQGRPIGTTQVPPPAPFSGRAVDPDLVVVMSSVLLMALGLPMSIAWAKRIWRRKPDAPTVPTDFGPRLANIERAVDAIAIEVERISEGQRFVTKIFVDRPAQSGAADSGSAAGGAAPKALGAGAMQPIDVAQRERASQRIITPH